MEGVNMGKRWNFGVVALLLLILAIVVGADSVTTTVWFNVPSVISFTVTLPGESPIASGTTMDILFNSTSTTINKLNATIAHNYTNQSATVPIFNYSNTGNGNINITVDFSSALPSGVSVKAGLNDSAWDTKCWATNLATATNNTCAMVNESANATVVGSLAVGTTKGVWLWADYSSVAYGTYTSRTLTHRSQVT